MTGRFHPASVGAKAVSYTHLDVYKRQERVQLYFGEVPLGDSLEPIVIRKGFVRQLLPGAKIGAQGNRPYYEVCTDPKLLDLARKKFAVGSPKS